MAFFILYFGVHVYVFLKAKAALSMGAGASIASVIFLLAMVSAPFITHYAEKAGYETIARLTAYAGYLWLGVLFLFFSYSIALDFYHFVLHICSVVLRKDLSFIKLTTRYSFYIAWSFALLSATYGYFEAKNIRTERLLIKSSKIPLETGRIRVVQISDIHLGLIVREERLAGIVEKVRDAGPDIVVSTGDLVDGQVCRLNGLSNILREMNPRYGKFAITGNHEFYAGFEQSRCFTEDSGFTLLRDRALSVAGITIAGADDPAAKNLGLFSGITERALLSGLPRNRFILFLKHRPLVARDSIGLFDLQLSGHVHKGQIFPFSLITKLYYPVYTGFAAVSQNAYLYVSRGAGTWGPPIRFLSPPEITVIDLVHADTQ